MDDIPLGVVVPLIALVVLVDGIALVDLWRIDAVQRAPRWAWALVIVVSFPLGAILYATLGRAPGGVVDEPAWDRRPTTTSPPPPSGPRLDAPPPPVPEAPEAAPPRATPRPDAPPVIRTVGLTRRFGDTVALDAVDVTVPRGSIYGLIGPNGAGKTTLLSLVTGLRRPTSGEVHVSLDPRRVAVLPDTPSFEPWLTAHEVVDLARTLQAPDTAAAEVDRSLAEVGLSEVADRRVGGFSRGMLQRLGLATCLVTDPDLLLLDEPSSALDPAGRREVLDLIGRLAGDRTVVLSTHILPDVQRVCDTVGVLDRGRLRYEGPLADLLQRTGAAAHLTLRTPCDEVVAALAAAAIVTRVEEVGPGQLIVHLTDAEAAERALPRLLADAGARVVSLAPATDLESAFLEMTS